MKTTKKTNTAEELNTAIKDTGSTPVTPAADSKDIAYVTVTDRIEPDTVKYIVKGVKEKFACGNVECKTDNSITGGFTVRYKGMFYDMSVATQLSQIKASLMNKED